MAQTLNNFQKIPFFPQFFVRDASMPGKTEAFSSVRRRHEAQGLFQAWAEAASPATNKTSIHFLKRLIHIP